jgi:hypothetical protein
MKMTNPRYHRLHDLGYLRDQFRKSLVSELQMNKRLSRETLYRGMGGDWDGSAL